MGDHTSDLKRLSVKCARAGEHQGFTFFISIKMSTTIKCSQRK